MGLRHYRFQITGALVAITYLVIAIFKSTNSTASIGFLFIPVATAIGAFFGFAIKYFWDVLQKKRPHSIGTTSVILAVVVFCAFKIGQTQVHKRDLRIAKNSSTSGAELAALLQRNDAEITHAVLSNPSLSVETLKKLIEENLTDYYLMSAAVQNPNLSALEMVKIASLERRDFKGDAEYEVYQDVVWARLARRKDIPEILIHKLAAKSHLEHFLVLALLDSPSVTCEEKKHFLPRINPVLESAIHRSMESQKCSR